MVFLVMQLTMDEAWGSMLSLEMTIIATSWLLLFAF